MSINQSLIDRYTLIHAASGVAFAYLRLNPLTVIGISIVWEALERPLKDNYRGYFPNPSQDSLGNSAVDVGATLGAYLLARNL